LRSTAVGEIEVEQKTLVIKRVHVTYHLTIDADADTDKVQRAFDAHPPRCPVYRSIHPQVKVSTALELERPGADA
jgi:uncharacterized OsmC-like protein